MTKRELPTGFRAVPSNPLFGVSKDGRVLNMHTNLLLDTWTDDGDKGISFYKYDPKTHKNTRVDVKVDDLISEAFAESEETEHGGKYHDCTLACTESLFGFKASPGEVNQMLWFMTGMVMRADSRYTNGSEVIAAVRQEIHDYNYPKPGEH